MDITQLLAFSVKNKASDLHLSSGLPPMIRVHGDVRRINVDPMSHKQVHGVVYDIMNDTQRKHYEDTLECDFSFEIQGLARFRVNAFNQNRGAAAVFRTIPSKILTLEQLNCPKIFAALAMKPRGLVLVTGPTGSGKSTTLAAIIDHLNDNSYGHVLTIEDPIEFVHASKKCLVNQREVGPQTLSFSNALRSALREDPDCILVGEMRDLETIRLALTAAETGHLVFGTLHTSSAAKTIDRVVDVFPAAEKDMVRAMLSESLVAVISQTLCKTKDGAGRVAAHEVMLGTAAIRNLIRENKIAQMYSSIQTGNSAGMQTLDQCLADLVRRNLVARFRRKPQPLAVAPRDDSSSYFATQFQEQHQDTQLMVSWDTRSIDLHTKPYDPALGTLALVKLFGQDPQLSQLGPEAVSVFGNYLEYVQVEAGRQVIGQDEQGDFLLIVLDGTVAVERVQPWGAKARLGESRAGDVLGEMSLLDAGARFSACTTLTPAKFAVLGAAALDRMMQHEPRLAAAPLALLPRPPAA